MNNFMRGAKKWFVRHLMSIIILVIVVQVIEFTSRLPYFNVFLDFPYPWNSLLVVWFISIFLFRLPAEISYLLSCLFLLVSSFFLVSLNHVAADTIGEVVFILILVGFAQHVYKFLHELKPRTL